MRSADSNPGPVWLVVAGLLTATLIGVTQMHYGAGVTPDGVFYYQCALHFINTLDPLCGGHTPPLYPFLLAIGARVFEMPLDRAATCINALAFGLTVGVSGLWLRRRGASVFVAVWACLLCGTSVLLYRTALALTDALFVCLTVLSLFALDESTNATRHQRLWLATATIAAACASVTRFGVGLPLIALLAIVVAGYGRNKSSKPRRLVAGASVAAAAAAPTAAWLLAVWPMTHEDPSGFSFSRIWSSSVRELWGWLFGNGRLSWWFDGLADAIGHPDVALARLWLRTVFLCVFSAAALGALVVAAGRRVRRTAALIACFLAAYSGFLVVILALADVRAWDPRYIVPLYAPGLVMAALALQVCAHKTRSAWTTLTPSDPLHAGSSSPHTPRSVLAALGWSGLLVGLAACQGAKLHKQVGTTLDYTTRHFDAGNGYSAKYWRHSETMNFLRELVPPSALVVTEDTPLVAYALNHLGEVAGAQTKGIRVAHTGGPSVEDVRGAFVAHRPPVDAASLPPVYAVWFHDLRQPGHWPSRTVQDLPRLKHWIGTPGLAVLRAFKDGVVFTLDPPPNDHRGSDRALDATSLQEATVAGVLADARLVYWSEAVRLYQHDFLDGSGRSDELQIGPQLVYHFRGCDVDRPSQAGQAAFLHVVPVDTADLADWRLPYGYDQFEGQLADASRYLYPTCLCIVDLPSYPVKSVYTGQHGPQGVVWHVDIALDPAT